MSLSSAKGMWQTDPGNSIKEVAAQVVNGLGKPVSTRFSLSREQLHVQRRRQELCPTWAWKDSRDSTAARMQTGLTISSTSAMTWLVEHLCSLLLRSKPGVDTPSNMKVHRHENSHAVSLW